MKNLLAQCLGLTIASSSGVMVERRAKILGKNEIPNHLYTVKWGEAKFVSVDVSTLKGIAKAQDLDLVGSGVAEAVITPLLPKATAHLFSTKRRARIFSVMRHPVERAASLFYYLQKATWERSFDPTLQSMTLEEYATSDKAESNWMVWMLNNEPVEAMDERHLKIAKQILREKVLIGLTKNMEESVQRFYSYFGWSRDDYGWSPCERDSLFGGTNSNKHPKVKEGTKAWELLASRNALDIALYEYAVELFHDQSSLFPKPVIEQPNVRGRR